MNNETSRKVLIVSASIGTGHMQAARAIEEYWKEKEPQASITHVDFLDTETMSVEHLIKGTYIKSIYLSSTMSKGVKVDPKAIEEAAK